MSQHTFSGAGWPHHQQMVMTCCGNFERSLGLRLTDHFRQIECVALWLFSFCCLCRGQRGSAIKELADLCQVLRKQSIQSLNKRSFGIICCGKYHLVALLLAVDECRHQSIHAAQFSAQREFAIELIILQRARIQLF